MTEFLRLQEVGRVLSKKHETALRQAVEVINVVLSKLDKGDAEDAVEKAVAEALREAAISMDEKRRKVSDAIRATYPGVTAPDGYVDGPFIRDIFDDFAIYEMPSTRGAAAVLNTGGLYKVSYVINDDGTVTLGTTQRVEERRDYVPVAEAQHIPDDPDAILLRESEVILPLLEKAVRKDGTIPVKIAQPGWGSSGYYSQKLLKEQGSKVFPKGTQMFWDHPTEKEDRERPERSLRDLAAVTVGDAYFKEDGPDGPGLYADAQVFEAYRPAVDELAPHIGVSLRAFGKGKQGVAEGKKGLVVESFIDQAASVDFVTKPGLGGKVLSLFESKRGQNVAIVAEPQKGNDVSQEELQEAQRLREAAELKLRAAQTRAAQAEAKDLARGILAKAEGLHEATAARLLEAAPNHIQLTDDGDLDNVKFEESFGKAVNDEQEYIKKLVGTTRRTSPVTGMGGTLLEASRGSASGADDNGADLDSELEAVFGRLGLSEAAAKSAAQGRN
jgi:hypothetical protein